VCTKAFRRRWASLLPPFQLETGWTLRSMSQPSVSQNGVTGPNARCVGYAVSE
jgi:hypothetical protein